MEPMEKELEIYGKSFKLKQEFNGELGATVWDTSIVLTKYFENFEKFPYPAYWKQKKILELGSGTGVVGIAICILTTGIAGTHVTLTDQPQLLPLLNYNVFDLNKIPASKASVKALKWGEKLENESSFDVIIMSDVVTKAYKEDFSHLVKTINAHANQATLILLAYEVRDSADKDFFILLKENNFSCTLIPPESLDPDYTADDIILFEIKKL